MVNTSIRHTINSLQKTVILFCSVSRIWQPGGWPQYLYYSFFYLLIFNPSSCHVYQCTQILLNIVFFLRLQKRFYSGNDFESLLQWVVNYFWAFFSKGFVVIYKGKGSINYGKVRNMSGSLQLGTLFSCRATEDSSHKKKLAIELL